jgi:uncharacterized Zn finger protein (UPF0148 family)
MERYALEEGTIKCPHCGELIPINSTLHKQLAETLEEDLKKKYEALRIEERKKWEQEAKQKAEAAVTVELEALNSKRPAKQNLPCADASVSLRNGRKHGSSK